MVRIGGYNPNGFNETPIKGIEGKRVRYLVLRSLGRGQTAIGVAPHVIVQIYLDTRKRYVATAIVSREDNYAEWLAIRTSEFREVLDFLEPHGATAEKALREAKRIPSVNRAATIAAMAVSGAGR